jgi:hypothetical protein
MIKCHERRRQQAAAAAAAAAHALDSTQSTRYSQSEVHNTQVVIMNDNSELGVQELCDSVFEDQKWIGSNSVTVSNIRLPVCATAATRPVQPRW